MVGTSCAGDALFAIFAGPRAETDDEYQRHWVAIAAAMPASAKANNGKASKNFNRLRFLAHDPDVWLADSVIPLLGQPDLEAAPRGVNAALTPSPAPVDLGDQGRRGRRARMGHAAGRLQRVARLARDAQGGRPPR